MNIRIGETNHVDFDASVLKDIGKFHDLPSWLLAIKNKKVAFIPQFCAIRIDNEWFPVVEKGQVAEDIDTTIEKVKCLPANYRKFPNDYIEIVADSFKGQLSFNTNYKSLPLYGIFS